MSAYCIQLLPAIHLLPVEVPHYICLDTVCYATFKAEFYLFKLKVSLKLKVNVHENALILL